MSESESNVSNPFPLFYSLSDKLIHKCEDPVKIRSAYDYYYKTHAKEMITDEIYEQIPDKKKLLCKLAAECFNRDFMKYLIEGEWGNSGLEINKFLD